METCIAAFSQYYGEDDPQAAAHIESALDNYSGITYEELHAYLTESLTEWYEKHPQAVEGSKNSVS